MELLKTILKCVFVFVCITSAVVLNQILFYQAKALFKYDFEISSESVVQVAIYPFNRETLILEGVLVVFIVLVVLFLFWKIIHEIKNFD